MRRYNELYIGSRLVCFEFFRVDGIYIRILQDISSTTSPIWMKSEMNTKIVIPSKVNSKTNTAGYPTSEIFTAILMIIICVALLPAESTRR